MKDKTTAALMAFFLGGIGVHRFYLGQTGLGFLYLLFCWTLIPAVIAFIDFIVFLAMNKENFDLKYNRLFFSQPMINNYGPASSITQKDAASEIGRLHELKEKGIITQAEFEAAKRKLI